MFHTNELNKQAQNKRRKQQINLAKLKKNWLQRQKNKPKNKKRPKALQRFLALHQPIARVQDY